MKQLFETHQIFHCQMYTKVMKYAIIDGQNDSSFNSFNFE